MIKYYTQISGDIQNGPTDSLPPSPMAIIPVAYDMSPMSWPAVASIKRSATGGAGVFFVSDHAERSVVVKPMPFSAPEVIYADNFIRMVGRLSVPRSRVYESKSPGGLALRDLLSTVVIQNERRAGELGTQISKAKHYIVMELAEGEPLSKVVREMDSLTALVEDREAMQGVARLMVLDSFLGSSDRLIFRDYTEHPGERPDPINLDNIMYSPEEGIIAIDNEALLAGNRDALLNSPNLHYLQALGDSREVNHLAYIFLSRLEGEFRRANDINRDQRLETLALALGRAHGYIVAGVYEALSEIGERVIDGERKLMQDQLEQFPDHESRNWTMEGLARYANWRFKNIDVTRESVISHEDAVQRLHVEFFRGPDSASGTNVRHAADDNGLVQPHDVASVSQPTADYIEPFAQQGMTESGPAEKRMSPPDTQPAEIIFAKPNNAENVEQVTSQHWWGHGSQSPTAADREGMGAFYELSPSLDKHFYRIPLPKNVVLKDHIALNFVGRDRQKILNGKYADFLESREIALSAFAKDAGVASKFNNRAVRANLDDVTRNNYPEIEDRYLKRRNLSESFSDAGKIFEDRNRVDESGKVVFKTRSLDVGDTRVAVHHEPTVRRAWLDERLTWVERAVEYVRAAGFTVPNLDVWIPKYTRAVELYAPKPGIFSIRSTSVGGFVEVGASCYGEGGIIIGELTPVRHSNRPNEFIASRLAEVEIGLIVHEIGHRLQDQFLLADSLVIALRDPSKLDLIGQVSEYAVTGVSPAEFVAEYFTGLVFGRPYRDELGADTADYLEQLYHDLGGPRPSSDTAAVVRDS